MKEDHEMPKWLNDMVYKLKQSALTVTVDSLDQLNVSESVKPFLLEIVQLSGEGEKPALDSHFINQAQTLGFKEIEEISTVVEVVVSSQNKKATIQYIQNQIVFPPPKSTVTIIQSEIEEKVRGYLSKIQTADVIQELEELYIPGEVSSDRYYTKPSNLEDEVQSFLSDPKLSSLLLLGESGFGKTMFCQKLSLSLARQYEAGKPIPLYISLPAVPNVSVNLIWQFLIDKGFSAEEIEYLKKNNEFVFILDSYDEVSSFKNNQLVNIYTANRLHEWKCKTITSCRTTYIINAAQYIRYFCPYKEERMLRSQLKELFLCPFSAEKIRAYVRAYLRVKNQEIQQLCENSELDEKWLDPEAYNLAFSELYGLLEIIKNPFLLKMTMSVLPACHARFKDELDTKKRKLVTSLDLYEKYTQAWFERQLDKLIWHTGGAPQYSNGQYMPEITVIDYQNFSQELAAKMNELGLVSVDSKDPRFKKFFDKSDERMVFVRKGVPLKNTGDDWSFIHYNFLQYFISMDGLEKQLALESQLQTLINLN